MRQRGRGAPMIGLILILATAATAQTILDIFRNHNQVNENIVRDADERPYDFIVVGAGSGGSVVANRLSENSKWRVLLVEAGGPEGVLNQIPMLVSFFQLTDYNWGYKVEPQSGACLGMKNHQCPWPRGKCLGGTSTLNYMIHTRGNRADYDIWAALGNKGWSYADVLQYFKKSERFRVPGVKNSSYHGNSGYLCVEHVPYHTELSSAFLEAGKRLGYKVLDYNGKEQIGFSYIQVNMDRGKRCSATTYLRVRRPNLHILTHAQATRVLIGKDNRAYGIEYMRHGKLQTVRATKEVIVSAGTIDSAKLLMLSGIGPREHLESLGIEVIRDSKVGHNLLEHVGFLGLTFMVDSGNRSLGLLQSKLMRPSVAVEYALHGKGLLTIPGGAEALAFVRTKYAIDSRPDVELLFASGSLHSDGGLSLRKGLGLTDELYNTVFRPIENKEAWSIWPIVQNPRSVGRILLKSKDPLEAPLIQPNFFEHPADLEIILEGVKHAIRLAGTEPMAALGSRLNDRKLPGCESFEFGSDDYWRCGIRTLPSMMNHECCTLKMGPHWDNQAVVDAELRVYGIKGLRVADASVMPTMPVGHINAGVFMIGEKAADMIKQAWEGDKSAKV
ncbi:glucose dehydrogenase [FAD, quinone]-like [Copidosoma floridanum]|uniref:glucose dehydrogenase [FAD, quinone]-like n=1 Tax=Copidosoma floridanum TaxID=29053 RepID=UPI0006C97412|nr:glucose dehydrogenase [FAD, quinone]-like [Copidosoma floridanum]